MSAGAGRYRMLVVDDQIDNLDLLERLFKSEFDVHRATDPLHAIELLREGPFEVIITDQRMPGMSGIELLIRSLELAPEAIRIVLTAYPDVDVAVASVNQARAFRFFTKPLDSRQLGEAVRGAVRNLELERENRRLAEELRTKSTLLEGLLAEKEGLIESRVLMRTRQLEAEIERLRPRVQLDESGALKPAAFRERVDAELARAARYEQAVAIMAVATPQLPMVEMEHGRERADQLARTVVEMLRLGSRRFDCVGRLGPDRFAVLLPQADPEGARARLDRLRVAFERFPLGALEDILGSERLDILGATVAYPQDAKSPSELVEAAERAVDAAMPQEGSGGMLY